MEISDKARDKLTSNHDLVHLAEEITKGLEHCQFKAVGDKHRLSLILAQLQELKTRTDMMIKCFNTDYKSK